MRKRRNHLQYIMISVMLFVLVSVIPAIASADTGPKPELVIKVIHPPEGEYYLDLLIQGDHVEPNIGERSEYDLAKLAILENYNEDGWFPALTVGTEMPLWGDLVGIKTENGMEHTFRYFGLPDDFKIILVTPDNQIRTTEQIHRESFRTVIVYDYATSVMKTETTQVSYTKQFIITFLTTILVEGLLLILFRFNLRKSLIPFLLVNFATQLFLTVTTGAAFASGGLLIAFIIFIPVEIIITVVEMVAFLLLLKEHSRGRRVLYAFTANFASVIVGLVVLLFTGQMFN